MKSQFGEILGGMGLLLLFLPTILFIVLSALLLLVINMMKLPLIFIISVISFVIMYDLFKNITKDITNKSTEISISLSILFSVILSYSLYTSWVYLIVAVAISIPLYGIFKEFDKESPLKKLQRELTSESTLNNYLIGGSKR